MRFYTAASMVQLPGQILKCMPMKNLFRMDDLTGKMKPDETPMFDPSLLKEVDWSQNTATFSPAISPTHPGEGLVLRPLCTADLNRGFFKVLGQLTETGVVNPEQFMKSFEHMKKSGDYYVTVVEDVTVGQIVATATLIIEHKFIHSCAKLSLGLSENKTG
ncbi:glucosamine 6-phosphate N-acetyltransferase isoform X3 [Marmota marmota marmota]|uniref:glucosamine 6-phosphate N-acetyltransferase isoform X3 n=1 Tax=Marmota marmota marmota TaxID=9994 RepID=UPI0020935B82|nr:glucosamine 6-phosphate N-acetyltransferase isoform X3 [Marmota marmota marmota]